MTLYMPHLKRRLIFPQGIYTQEGNPVFFGFYDRWNWVNTKWTLEVRPNKEGWQNIPPLRLLIIMFKNHIDLLGPVGSNHGNLGLCLRPWRGVVTDPSKHCYLPRLGDCAGSRSPLNGASSSVLMGPWQTRATGAGTGPGWRGCYPRDQASRYDSWTW